MKKLTIYFLFIVFGNLLFFEQQSFCEELTSIPRKVIALYNSKNEEDIWYSNVLQYAAMPLEYQGLYVVYYDIKEGFPNIQSDPSILGAVVWDLKELDDDQKKKYINWALETVKTRKKIVLLGTLPGEGLDLDKEWYRKIFLFWKKMGLSLKDRWVGDTFGLQFKFKDLFMCEFERQYLGMLPGFQRLTVATEDVTPYLSAIDGENSPTILIMTCPLGGYAAQGYA